jgi:hypothetical protein
MVVLGMRRLGEARASLITISFTNSRESPVSCVLRLISFSAAAAKPIEGCFHYNNSKSG